MQLITRILLFSCVILSLFNCSKEPISTFSRTDFVLSEKEGKVVVINKSIGGTDYELFLDGVLKTQSGLKDTLGIFQFDVNGEHSISICSFDILQLDFKGKSCKDTTFTITSLPPIIDWDIFYLGKGKVSIVNNSKHTPSPTYSINQFFGLCGYSIINVANPTLLQFEKNGVYQIQYDYFNGPKTIEISDLPETEPYQKFEGTFFDKKGTIISNNVNDFYCSYGFLSMTYVPKLYIYSQDVASGLVFINNKSFRPTEYYGDPRLTDKYNYFKSIFKVGEINPKDWDISTYSNNNFIDNRESIQKEGTKIEIIDVKEVEQEKIVPNMLEKAFWVTFKIKATIKEKGVIDGTFKVKYMIY